MRVNAIDVVEAWGCTPEVLPSFGRVFLSDVQSERRCLEGGNDDGDIVGEGGLDCCCDYLLKLIWRACQPPRCRAHWSAPAPNGW